MMWICAAFVLVGMILPNIGTEGKEGSGTMTGKAVEKGKKE
jgi:hypothetical protein